MRRKVRTTATGGNGPTPQPTAGLSDERLALVHRYLANAVEAEERARGAAADKPQPAELQEQPETKRGPRRAGGERRLVKDLLAKAASVKRGFEGGADPETLRPSRSTKTLDRVTVEQVQRVPSPTSADQRTRASRGLAREEKLAAKQAARVIAALEKKEARERKALAKAAARRKAKGISRA